MKIIAKCELVLAKGARFFSNDCRNYKLSRSRTIQYERCKKDESLFPAWALSRSDWLAQFAADDLIGSYLVT